MVLDLIVIGLAITVDPLPLSASFVVLPSKRGVRKGAALTPWSLIGAGAATVVQAKVSDAAIWLIGPRLHPIFAG